MKKIPKGLLPWARELINGAEHHLSILQCNTQVLKNLRKGDILTTKEGLGVRKYKIGYTVDCIMDKGISLKSLKGTYLTWAAFIHHEKWFNVSAYARKA